MGVLLKFIEKFKSWDDSQIDNLEFNFDDFDLSSEIKFAPSNHTVLRCLHTQKKIKVSPKFHTASSVNKRQYLGGGEPFNESKTLANKIYLKNDTELALIYKREALETKIEKLGTISKIVIDDDLREEIKRLSKTIKLGPQIDLSELKLKDLDYLDSYLDFYSYSSSIGTDYYDYLEIELDFQAIKVLHNIVKTLSKQISFLFNLLKKRLRNLRQFFTKLHSFHFKNLDDYHSVALTSVLVG